MVLVSPQKVTQALMASGGSAAVASNALPAVETASRVIADLVGTEFAFTTQTDYFHSRGKPFPSDLRVPVRFRLTNGFLTADGISLRYSTDSYPLRTPEAGTLLEDDDANGGYFLDKPKGIVTLLSALPIVDYGISITYSSGFDVDPTSEFGLLLDVPDWVEKAALALSVYCLKTFPSTPAHRASIGKGMAPNQLEAEVYAMANTIISAKRRPRVNMQFPALSIVQEDE